jgi:hypothetical protein
MLGEARNKTRNARHNGILYPFKKGLFTKVASGKLWAGLGWFGLVWASHHGAYIPQSQERQLSLVHQRN